jgi:hypothetical protein
MRDSLRDVGLYTLWAGILVLCELVILLVQLHGVHGGRLWTNVKSPRVRL